MSEDREFWDDQHPDGPDAGAVEDGDLDAEGDEQYPLLSADAFDDELEALAAYTGDDAEETVPDDEYGGDPTGALDDDVLAERDAAEIADRVNVHEESETGDLDSAPPVDSEEDRLRQPRAGRFRRAVRNQLGMLPLALLLLGMGAFLLARGQKVEGLPDVDDQTLAIIAVLTVGFTAVFHALLSGRRERGLLFVGLWVLVTAGLIAGLLYFVESDPDVGQWWPLVLWSTALTLLLTYLVERTHDGRLVLLAVVTLVAGITAYLVSSGEISDDTLDTAADYWPLVLTVIGVGLLPLVFRRRMG